MVEEMHVHVSHPCLPTWTVGRYCDDPLAGQPLSKADMQNAEEADGVNDETVAGNAFAHEKELRTSLEAMNLEEKYINNPFQVSDDDDDEHDDYSVGNSNDAIFNLMSFSDSRVKIQDLVKKATRTPPRNRETSVSPRSQNVKHLSSAVRTLNTLLDDIHNDALSKEGSTPALNTSPSQQKVNEHEEQRSITGGNVTPGASESDFSMTNENVISTAKVDSTNKEAIDEINDLDYSISGSTTPGTILDEHPPEYRLEILKKEVSSRPVFKKKKITN